MFVREVLLVDHYFCGNTSMHLLMGIMLAIALGYQERINPTRCIDWHCASNLDTLGTCLDHIAEVTGAGASESQKSQKVRHFATRRTSEKAPESLSKPLSHRSQSRQIGNFVFKNFSTRITRSVKKSTPMPVFRLELYSGHLEMVWNWLHNISLTTL